MTRDKAMYFWLRHLEGADPKTRTLKKWNKAYPKDRVKLKDITDFISEMLRLKATGLGDYLSMKDILDRPEGFKVFRRKKGPINIGDEDGGGVPFCVNTKILGVELPVRDSYKLTSEWNSDTSWVSPSYPPENTEAINFIPNNG